MDCCRVIFNSLKAVFLTALILMHWNPNLPVIVKTDVSDHTLAAIISTHTGEDIHPITFYSRAFSFTELNYDIHDKELLIVFETFKKWHHYCKGTSRVMLSKLWGSESINGPLTDCVLHFYCSLLLLSVSCSTMPSIYY